MGGRYRAYPEYKDSGVEWFGEVPEHWEVKKLKYIANISPSNVDKKSKREEVPVQLCNYTDVYYNDVISASDNYMKATATEEQVRKFTLLAGDTIVTKDSEDTEDIAIPAFVPKDLDGVVCGYHLALIRPYEERYGALIKRNFEATYVRAYMGTRANGLTRYGLGTYALSNSFFAQPPPQEAIDIANFLDHETAKIDTLIEKQQQLIALLKEKRQAVISHAVTKGLNPDAPMKDSGVEWLGEVPEHWRVAKLSYRYEVLLGKMLDDKRITRRFLAPYLRNTDVQWNSINTVDLPEMDFYHHEHDRYSVLKGDLLVCEGGEIGRCAIWNSDEPCYYQKALHRLRPIDSRADETRFMFYILSDAVHQERFLAGAGKATIAHLPAETFRQYKFAYPPHEEQLEIVDFLDRRKEHFELLEAKARRQISLLQERRTALISAAVTGKIDVRNWQPPTDKDIQ